MIHLLCVEDDPLVRTYLTTRLSQETGIHVVGAVSDLDQCLIHLHRDRVDLVLLDRYLITREGTHLLQAMYAWSEYARGSEEHPTVLFCTGYADEAFEAQARQLGAQGVVAKERMAQELIPAVRTVAGGGSWFRSGAAERE
jgi:DNA-binding NarL/FixJ family response regulator